MCCPKGTELPEPSATVAPQKACAAPRYSAPEAGRDDLARCGKAELVILVAVVEMLMVLDRYCLLELPDNLL